MQYFGGKQRIGKAIASVVLSYEQYPGQPYLDPFCGMLGVTRHINSTYRLPNESVDRKRSITCSDLQPYIIGLWNSVKNGWQPPQACTLERHTELKMQYRRSRLPDGSPDVTGMTQEQLAESAFYAFGLSWSGLFFHRFYEKNVRIATNALNSMREKVQDMTFSHCSYLTLQPHGSLIYVDPPYLTPSGDAATKYEGCPRFDLEEFWAKMREWSSDNVVLVSERTAPEDFVCVWEKDYVRCFRLAYSGNAKCPTYKERLFMYKPLHEKIK